MSESIVGLFPRYQNGGPIYRSNLGGTTTYLVPFMGEVRLFYIKKRKGSGDMYAVEFFLDEKFESYVRNIWSGLKTTGITSYMADIEELRPHVTVAVYDSELPLERFISRFDSATKNMYQIDVKFDIISTFPTSGTVFFHPTMTSHLFETHRQYYNDLAGFNTSENRNGYSFPERWDPHCN